MENTNIEFVPNVTEDSTENQNENNCTLLLEDPNELEHQLEEFKKACDSYDKHQRKRKKKRFYTLALMAKIGKKTSPEEIKRLLKNNTRTFLVDSVENKLNEVQYLLGAIDKAIDEQQEEETNIKLVIGKALQITGDACRIGRVRNNASLSLCRCEHITLTINTAYRYSCFKEIAFVINLHYYLPSIRLNDEILIGKEASGVVVKILKTAITVCILKCGIVNSYDLIDLPNQCYVLNQATVENIVDENLKLPLKLHVDFICLPDVRCLQFIKLLKQKVMENHHFKIIGNIDLLYINRKMLDISSIIKQLDYLWLTNLFGDSQLLNTILKRDVIPSAKCLKRPIIGSVPLEHCNDFKLFENHEFLFKIDCIHIEKSAWCNKYPLIVKKLLPLTNFRIAMVENACVMKDMLANCQSIVNFVIRTISTIECQAIFLDSSCETAAKALSRVEVYCPVYVMVLLKEPTEDNMEQYSDQIAYIKDLNLRRTLLPIPFTPDMNECEFKAVDYGIEYARKYNGLETGDFIITIEVIKEEGDLGVDEDTVLMRAIYVPSPKVGEAFKCR